VTVIPDYRGYRIETEAAAIGFRWNAIVTIRRIGSRDPSQAEDSSQVEIVTCLKLTPELAESAGEIWAKRWIDVQLNDEPKPAPQ
jgi:hypothetical protein